MDMEKIKPKIAKLADKYGLSLVLVRRLLEKRTLKAMSMSLICLKNRLT